MAIEDAFAGESSGRATRDAINRSLVTLNHNHLLYLSSSDVPGALLIWIQLTGMENYIIGVEQWKLHCSEGTNWDLSMDLCCAMISKENWRKFGIATMLSISWLTYNLSKKLLSGMLYFSSAHEVWLDLKEIFDKVNGSRLYQLRRSIFTLTQGILFVSTYYKKLKNLSDEYDSILPPPSCDCS